MIVLAVSNNEGDPITAATICSDGAPAQAQSLVGRYDDNGNAVWFPNDPALYYACP